MDKKLAIDVRRLWAFIECTQHDVLNEYKGKRGLFASAMKVT